MLKPPNVLCRTSDGSPCFLECVTLSKILQLRRIKKVSLRGAIFTRLTIKRMQKAVKDRSSLSGNGLCGNESLKNQDLLSADTLTMKRVSCDTAFF